VLKVKVKSEVGGVAARFEKLWGPTLGAATLQAAEHVAGEIRRQISAWVSDTDTRKTGALMRSFRPGFKKDEGKRIHAGVYSTLKYARIHDQGGTIRPKSARALAIPLNDRARRRRPRSFPNMILLKKEGSSPVLGLLQNMGKKHGPANFTPMFVLKPFDRIRAKHYIAKAADASLPIAREVIRKGLQEAAQKSLAARNQP
jgi:hypothetical protein